MIKNALQNARKNNLQTRPQHSSPIDFDESNELIYEIVHGNITHEEALNKMAEGNGVAKAIKENNKGELYVSESKSVYSDEQKESNKARQRFAEQLNEQSDTTDMPELESEESAV